MAWLELLEQREALVLLFPERDPGLASVRLLEMAFHQDGPRVLIRFNLNEYPANPPKKWKDARYNTVQVQIRFVGITSIQVERWSANNIGDIAMARSEDGGVAFSFTSPGSQISGVFQWAYLDQVSAYHNTERDMDPDSITPK